MNEWFNNAQQANIPYVGYPTGSYYGTVMPQVNMPVIKGTLTPEEERETREMANPQISLKPTELEIRMGQCNHWYSNGGSALELNPMDNTYTCKICGTKIDLNRPYEQADVVRIVDDALNLIEQTKFSSFNMPTELKKDLFGTVIPWLRKIPMMWQSANQNISSFQRPVPYNTQMHSGNVLYADMMNSMPGSGMYGYGQQPMMTGYGQPVQMPQQPMMAGYGQPMYQPQPQPMMNAGWGQATAAAMPANDAFYTGVGQPQQPMMGGYQPMPQAQPVAPAGINPAFAGGYTAPPAAQQVAPSPAATAPVAPTTANTDAPVKQTGV